MYTTNQPSELIRPPDKVDSTDRHLHKDTRASWDEVKKSSASYVPETQANSAKRMSVSLSADAVQALEFLAKTQGISQSEVIRKALATELYLQREISQGSKVLVQKSNNEIRELIFR